MAVKAMILAAGLGCRLRPLTDTVPKVLLPVGGRPVIAYNLYLLRKYGFEEVIINVHYLADQIKETLGDGRAFGLRISYSDEPDLLDTGGGINKVRSQWEDSTLLVLNGDVIVDLDVERLISFHQGKGGVATLVLRDDAHLESFGPIEVNGEDRIGSILGRPRPLGILRRMFTGVHIIEPAVMDVIPSGQRYSIIDAYIHLLASGKALYGHLMNGYWNDIGTLERYEQAKRDALAGVMPL